MKKFLYYTFLVVLFLALWLAMITMVTFIWGKFPGGFIITLLTAFTYSIFLGIKSVIKKKFFKDI